MPKRSVTRRDFILAGAAGAGALAVGAMAGRSGASLDSFPALGLAQGSTLVVSRRNGTVAQMVNQAVADLGGIGAFVSSGMKVAVKVNGSWDMPSADTSPEVVKQAVLLIQSVGPSKVTVYDHTIDGNSTYPNRGWKDIAAAAQSAGAEAVMLGDDSSSYVSKSIPGVGLKSAMVAKILDSADVLVNVPKLKTHGQASVTVSLKNHLGTVQDRNAVHNAGGLGLQQGIADLNTCPTIKNKHRLTICDAIQPMVTGGPKYGTYVDYNGVLAGYDPVATDYIGTQIIRRYNSSVPETPTHIYNAAALGLGTTTGIEFYERDVGVPIPEQPVGLIASMAGAALLSGWGLRREE